MGRDMFMANGVCKRRMLGLYLSDLDKMLCGHTLGDEERSSASFMCVIIIGAAICRITGFGHRRFWPLEENDS